jgi:type IV pilus assembly protein PilY1
MFDTPRRHHMPALIVACLTSLSTLQVRAAISPSQQPLLKKAGGSVAPNIFYTLDDSGSMGWSYAPSSAWPGESNGVFPMLHPDDDLINTSENHCTAWTPVTAVGAKRTDLTADQRMNVDLRSPQVNRIYYNPEILYTPWAKGSPYSDATGLFTASKFTAANTDPRRIIDTKDTGAATGVINLDTRVAIGVNTSPSLCGSSSTSTLVFTLVTKDRYLYPATYYLQNKSTGVITRYTLNSDDNPPATITFSSAYSRRTDCTLNASGGTSCSLAAERQNFANWFTYYRIRSLLARGATSLAFSKIDQQVRVGYGQLNNGAGSKEGSTTTLKTITRGVRNFDVGTTDRTDFFKWLYKVPYLKGTPLRTAMDDVGRYFSITNSAGPWSSSPGGSSYTNGADVWKNQASCRRSYHVLMTDGYWNGNAASTTGIANVNVDNTTGPDIANNESGRTYKYDPSFTNGISSKPPYKDAYLNTLADVAQYYWSRDLHPGLANNVRVKFSTADKSIASKPFYSAADKIDRGDHAFWQHLSTYTVGLGITGTITDTSTVPPANDWPKPLSDDATAVDDLFHAAVNGRGRYLKASDPQEYQDAIEQALNEIFAAEQANSGLAFSSFEVNGDSRRYIPSFSQPDWTGDVTAYPINSDIATWSASAMLPDHTQRSIGVWNGASIESFNTSMSASLKTLMGAPTNEQINFLRGDRSQEGASLRCRGDIPNTKNCTKVKDANGNYTKNGLFGDVVNSPPLLVAGGVNLNYQLLPDGEGAGYLDFVATKQARTNKVLLVGANDGMLHVLNEATGKELYAYIPQAVTPFLKRLTNMGYGSTTDDTLDTTHHFFVDGQLSESDAKVGGSWANVVVGSTGSGAKSVFALKFSALNPQSISSTPVMWEINALPTSTLSDKDKLGHVNGSISVGRMKNGRWVAIFGNGMASTAGGAYLWIVDIATGTPIRSPIQAGTDTSDNGLGSVTVVRDSTRTIVAAYAGDAKGRLWRFDLHNTNSSEWQAGFSNTPLLTPSAATPVSAAPVFTTHPKGGLMVMYATGRLFSNADASDSSQQYLYAIWDPTLVGKASQTGAGATESQLVEHAVNTTAVSSSPEGYAITPSSTTITYTDAAGTRGWKVKQSVAAGERAIYDPFLLSNFVVFNTIAPTVTNVGDPCTSVTSQSFLYFLMPLSGKMAPYAIADTNGDGVVNASDVQTGVIKIASDGGAAQPYRCKDGKCPCPAGQTCTGGTSRPCPSGGRAYGVATSKSAQNICSGAGYNVRTWQQIQNIPRKAR